MSTVVKRRRRASGYRATVNPSKRHRDRLNAELDNLAKLLPLSEDIIARLDKLSVLRLSVSYLKNKNFFRGALQYKGKAKEENGGGDEYQQGMGSPAQVSTNLSRKHGLFSYLFNEAIDGFIIVVTTDGEIFMISESVKSYLGYSQSQTLHQSLFTLVHEDDHEELRTNLNENGGTPKIIEIVENRVGLGETAEKDEEPVTKEFVVRMKSVLNTSSSDMYRPFKISGTLRELGINPENKKPQKALFAVCTPARSSHSILEIRMKSTLFCSKNRLDLSFLDMDARGKEFFGYTKKDLFGRSSYVMVHRADLQHLRCKHTEIITVGKTTLATFRLLNKNNEWSWVCGYARVLYKHSRPDFVVTTNRLMSEEEGQAMLRIRDDEDCRALARIGFYLPENPDEAMKLGFPLTDSTQQPPRECTINFNLASPMKTSPGNFGKPNQVEAEDFLTDRPEHLFEISDDLMNSSPEEILASPGGLSSASADPLFDLSPNPFVSSLHQGRSPDNEINSNQLEMPTTCASVRSESLSTLSDHGNTDDNVAAFHRQLSGGSGSLKTDAGGFNGTRGLTDRQQPKLSVANLTSTLNNLEVHTDPNALQTDSGALFDEISILDSYLNQHTLQANKDVSGTPGSSPGHTLTDISRSSPQVRSYGNFNTAMNTNGRMNKPVNVPGQNGLSSGVQRSTNGILRVAPQMPTASSRDVQDKKKNLLGNVSFTAAMFDQAPPNVTVTASDSNLQNIQHTLGIPRTTLGHSASPTFPFMNTQSPTMTWNGPQQHQQQCGPQSMSAEHLNTTAAQLIGSQGAVINHVGMVTQPVQGVRGFYPQFIAREQPAQRGGRQGFSWM